jgi:hypothetical protein
MCVFWGFFLNFYMYEQDQGENEKKIKIGPTSLGDGG